MYNTTDGHNFSRKEDAKIWQSVIDFVEVFGEDREIIGLGQYQYLVKNEKEFKILVDYLTLYMKFDTNNINIDFSKEKYPLNVYVDNTDKIFEY